MATPSGHPRDFAASSTLQVGLDAGDDGRAIGLVGDACAGDGGVDRIAVGDERAPALARAGRSERQRAEQGEDQVPGPLALGGDDHTLTAE